jgi:hypothetical protein
MSNFTNFLKQVGPENISEFNKEFNENYGDPDLKITTDPKEIAQIIEENEKITNDLMKDPSKYVSTRIQERMKELIKNTDPKDFAKILQESKKEFAKLKTPLATENVSIIYVQNIDNGDPYEEEFELTVTKFKFHYPSVDVRNTYDLNHLKNCVLEKIMKAQKEKKLEIELENYCCINSDCPEMKFMKLFIRELRFTD